MGVLLKDDVQDQLANRLINGQRHAWQDRRTSRSQLRDTMVGPGQDVAVEDSCGIPRDRLGQEASSGGDQFAGPSSGLSNDRCGHCRFHPTKLAVEGRNRSHFVELSLQERRTGRLPEAAGDVGHNLHEMAKQEFSGVLSLGDLIEDEIDRGTLDHPIDRDAGHDGHRRFLRKRLETGWDNHWDLPVRTERSCSTRFEPTNPFRQKGL